MKREEGASQACFAAICILTMAVWFWDLDGGTMEGWNSHLTQPVEVKPMFRVETRPPEEFVQVSGTKFNWRGKNFHFVGTNCYYAAMKAAEPETKHLSMHIFDGMEEMGLNVLRTWAFREGKRPQTMQPSPGVYSEASFLGLDWVVREAGRRGIKLILTLTDYWEEYGGMQQYVEWSRSAQVVEHFYTDDWCKRWYKMYVSAVLNRVNKFTGKRYKDDPTIMAWELANEARNERDPSGLVVQQWTAEMSAYVKSIDPFHLVTTGSEGFFGTSCPSCNPAEYYANLGVVTEQQHALEDIDYISAHLWPDIWLDEGLEHHNFAENWMTAQAHLGNQLNKPFVLGEFGKSPHGSQREEFFYSVLQSFLSVAQKGHSAGGILFWTLASSSYLDYDGFTVYPFSEEEGKDSLTPTAQSPGSGTEEFPCGPADCTFHAPQDRAFAPPGYKRNEDIASSVPSSLSARDQVQPMCNYRTPRLYVRHSPGFCVDSLHQFSGSIKSVVWEAAAKISLLN